MKYPNKHIEEYVKVYSTCSDDDLKIVMKKNNEWSDLHIAAKLVLEERARQSTDIKHTETISMAKEANKLSRIAIGVSILSLIVAVIAFCDNKKSTSQEKPATELQKPTSNAASPSNAKLPTQPEKAMKDKGQ